MTEEVVGFFIVETHVLNTTGSFRSPREVEDLWEALLRRVGNAVDTALKNVSDADAYLGVKECLLSFTMTLEVSLPSLLCAVYAHEATAILVLDREFACVHLVPLRSLCVHSRVQVRAALREGK